MDQLPITVKRIQDSFVATWKCPHCGHKIRAAGESGSEARSKAHYASITHVRTCTWSTKRDRLQ